MFAVGVVRVLRRRGLSHDAKKLPILIPAAKKIKCSAVCAAEIILTSKYGENAATKLHAEFEQQFKDKVGAINCREIRSKNLRPCIGCVEDSATILENMLTR